jgi:hypothetical protein
LSKPGNRSSHYVLDKKREIRRFNPKEPPACSRLWACITKWKKVFSEKKI